jgi:hypothetical protein
MVVITDLIPDTTNIHPTPKKEVAKRLSDMALNKTYGYSDISSESPLYSGHTIEKDKIKIQFTNTANGLISTGVQVTSFEIAAEDKVFLPAQAKIEGFNFDSRKHTLEYDDVLNFQRKIVYERRRKILTAEGTELKPILDEFLALENTDDATKTFEEFKNDHEREAERQIKDLKNKADFIINNDNDLEDLYLQIDEIINKLK